MSETVTAPDILNEIKAGRLVVVPREAEQRMLEAAGRYADGCAIHNYGAPPDADGTWDAMLAASPDHTTALLSLVEGMERERYEARALLERCRTVLGNMARENEGAIFNRWPINHEPLRADARNLLPLIEKEIGCES